MHASSKNLPGKQLRWSSMLRAVLRILDHSLDALLCGRSPLSRRRSFRAFASSREILLLLLLSATAAHARLGENAEQLEVRYGTAIKTNGVWRLYEKDGYRIGVDFFNGKSASEVVMVSETVTGFDQARAQAMATQIANGADWGPAQRSSGITLWISQDKKTFAGWTALQRTLVVQTVEFQQVQAAQKKKPVPGF